METFVLKSARHTEAHGARRRRTHHGCEAQFYAKIFKVFHISQSIFCKNKLDKCIKNVTTHQYDY